MLITLQSMTFEFMNLLAKSIEVSNTVYQQYNSLLNKM